MPTLTKGDGANSLDGMRKLDVGISWDKTSGSSGKLMGRIKKQIGTDLDLIAILMQGADPVRLAGLDSLDPLQNGSVRHSGDNQTGAGDGDDEVVYCDLAKIQSNVTAIVFVAAAFKKGSNFENAANISFKVYDSSDGKQDQVADIWPSLVSTGNACAICKIVRNGNAWDLVVVNETGRVNQGDMKSLLQFGVGK